MDPWATAAGVLDASAPWCRRVEGGWSLTIRVQPGANRSEVAGPHGDELRVRVAGPPVDGKANAELVRFLAAHLGVPRRSVTITRGQTSRTKVVRVLSPGGWTNPNRSGVRARQLPGDRHRT